MYNANKIARYITTINSTPSYAINILVAKQIAVSETFFFFIHTLIKNIMLFLYNLYLSF